MRETADRKSLKDGHRIADAGASADDYEGRLARVLSTIEMAANRSRLVGVYRVSVCARLAAELQRRGFAARHRHDGGWRCEVTW